MRQGLEVAIALGARGDEAYAHAGMGWILEMYGAYGPGLRESTMAIELARQIGHREWTAAGLHNAGRIVRVCGQATRARALHEEMLTLTRELGTALFAAAALAELGADLIELGDEAEGDRLLDEAITEAVKRPSSWSRPSSPGPIGCSASGTSRPRWIRPAGPVRPRRSMSSWRSTLASRRDKRSWRWAGGRREKTSCAMCKRERESSGRRPRCGTPA
jgi:hypothetical protein